MLFRINKVEGDLKKLQADMSSLMRKIDDVLLPQIDELASRVAQTPQPLRANWVRKSAPAWERETVIMPSMPSPLAARISGHLALLKPPAEQPALLPPPPARHVKRVTICMSGSEQFVNAYDTSEQKIPYLCGRFKDVGLKVLEAAGSLEWEEVFLSA